jgi:hypothetical protein
MKTFKFLYKIKIRNISKINSKTIIVLIKIENLILNKNYSNKNKKINKINKYQMKNNKKL